MKLAKLSLAAVLIMGANAFAIDNVKVNGATKLIYQTTDKSGSFEDNNDMFSKESAQAQVSATLGVSANLIDGVSAGMEMQALSTLGLENQLVMGVMNDTLPGGAGTDDAWNVSQMWIATTLGNTTAKIGRQELNTPLAFTEKWNIVKNTFEAAVLINSDVPKTTLVGAYVGGSNADTAKGLTTVNMPSDGSTGFSQFYGGAYAAGAITTAIPMTTAQAWYYDVNTVATATFFQTDTKIDMITGSLQYATVDQVAAGAESNDVMAAKIAADLGVVKLYGAYSQTGKSNTAVKVGINTATLDKTKIFTGAGSIYFDGNTALTNNTSAFKLGVSGKVGSFGLSAAYAQAKQEADATRANNSAYDNDSSVVDLVVKNNIGPVAVKAVYTSYKTDTSASTDGTNNTLRIYATLKF
ncbi:MAG: hypothetical protein GQ570_07100 [Helicobacteraceae bacterium]|nr:hypothetical protein [Helicobacteraceae bacterium]